MEPLYRLRVPDRLEGLIRGLHPQLKGKVRAALDLIRADPSAGTELRDDLAGLRSFRVGRHRIIYRVAPRRLIELVALGPRRSIYEDTFRLLRRQRGQGRPGRAETGE
jgi:mRNA interferase RelE/StbE